MGWTTAERGGHSCKRSAEQEWAADPLVPKEGSLRHRGPLFQAQRISFSDHSDQVRQVCPVIPSPLGRRQGGSPGKEGLCQLSFPSSTTLLWGPCIKSHQGCLYQEDHQGGKGGCRTERLFLHLEQSPEQVGPYTRVSLSCQTSAHVRIIWRAC